jgi:HEPN domain-containing protein
MPEIEKVITVAGEWVKKAENDLKNASYTLELDDECPTDTVCFHAQQVVEKYLKALLVFSGIPFPKSRNIEDIIAPLPPSSRPRLAV